MKKLVSGILACALMLCLNAASFASEVKEIVIDTDVPVFDDLEDGESYAVGKSIYIADLSEVNCILLKAGSATVNFMGESFSGYSEVTRKESLSCINYTLVATINDVGSYMIYAKDIYDHDIAVRFKITASGSDSSSSSSSGGGGGGGGGGIGAASTVKAPYANGDTGNGGGALNAGERITLSSETKGAVIYYTKDGTEPSKKSSVYNDTVELILAEGDILKAVAIKGGVSSEVSVWSVRTVSDRKSLVSSMLECDEHIVYMSGYPDNTFRAENNMTRAEVAVMFARIMKEKPVEGKEYTCDFTDVSPEDWYADYIGFMKDFSIINGYSDGTFRPNNQITRAEFVTIACRFVETIGETEADFTDVDGEHWAYSYIAFAAKNGWVNGYDEGTFRPERTIKRAEAVAIVNRMLVRAADKKYVDENGVVEFSDITPSHWAYYEIAEASTAHDYVVSDGAESWK